MDLLEAVPNRLSRSDYVVEDDPDVCTSSNTIWRPLASTSHVFLRSRRFVPRPRWDAVAVFVDIMLHGMNGFDLCRRSASTSICQNLYLSPPKRRNPTSSGLEVARTVTVTAFSPGIDRAHRNVLRVQPETVHQEVIQLGNWKSSGYR